MNNLKEHWKRPFELVERVAKLKAEMLKRNPAMTLAKTNCIAPCDGELIVSIVPYRKRGAARAYCTKCDFRMME